MANKSVAWKSALLHDGRAAQQLEDVFRKCCAFAGIHDFDFGDKVTENFVSISDWVADTAGGTTWSVATGELVVTGGAGGFWYQAYTTQSESAIEPSFVASFDLLSGEGAFMFHGKTGANDAYIAWWDATNCGFAKIDNTKVGTNVVKMPYGIIGPARIQVAVKWRLDSVDDSRKWMLATLYVDGREFAAYAEDIGDTAYDWTGNEMGFAVDGGNTFTVDNLTVSEITRIIDYASVDVGEAPASGLSRALGTTRLKYHARYDGTIRVRRPGNRDVDWVIPATRRVVGFTDRSHRRAIPTHVRTIGVIHSIDRFDDDEGDIHMHRFYVQDDPNVVSLSETFTEAGLFLNEMGEKQTRVRWKMAGNPLTERGDRVTYDSTDYRVLMLHHVYTFQKGPVFSTQIDAQGYIEV